MDTAENGGHDGGPIGVEDWVGPFRRALEMYGRPADKHKWHIVWARKLEKHLYGKSLREATRNDAEEFLATLSTSSAFAPWQVDQAADSLRILIGSVFGQGRARSLGSPAPPPHPGIPASVRCRSCSGTATSRRR